MTKEISLKIAGYMKEHYSRNFEEHGPNSKGVDWGKDTMRVVTRHQKMANLFLEQRPKNHISILDVGCGYGEFFGFLNEIGQRNFSYTGIDIVSEMVEKGAKKHPNAKFLFGDFLTYEFNKDSFDYLICNGIFTQKLKATTIEMIDYLKDFLYRMHEMSKRGFAFNVMTSYVNYQVSNLFYFSPTDLLSYLLTNISKKVCIDHNLNFYEYVCYVYK